MSLASIVRNVEIERDNNRELALRMDGREEKEIAEEEMELSQLEALVANKRRRLEERRAKRLVVREEFVTRDAALLALIEGDGVAQ